MFVVYPDGQHQNKPMLSYFHHVRVPVLPTAMVLFALSKHGDWVVQSVKTNIHLDRTTTSHHEMQFVPSASLCAFFAAVVCIRTVDPMFCAGPFHTHFHQCLADRVWVNLMIRPSFLVTYFRQHFQCPQTAFVPMLSWRLAYEFSHSFSAIVIIGSLIIMPCSRLQFQTTDPFLIESVQHFPDLLITLPNSFTDFSGCLSLICTHQDDLTAPDGCSNRRFQPVFQFLALFFTRFSCINCFHSSILSLFKLSEPFLH